jgi:predicted nucleotidyltransferase
VVAPEIVTSVRQYLRALAGEGIQAAFGVVYGSQATGRAHEWSDIDLVVVSPRFDGRKRRRDIERLWTLTASTDCRIEPVACGEREWAENDTRPIIEIARQEGEIITLN